MSAPLRVCVIASSRYPVAEPFAGGLEAHTHSLVRALTARGHEVSLFAAPGSDPSMNVTALDVRRYEMSEVARTDVSARPADWMREHHAYLGLMLGLARAGASRYDVVHNNSLHHLPIAMAASLGVPMLTTLHTPPTPWLESAIGLAPPGSSSFAAVSRHTAAAWEPLVRSAVVLNGVDTTRWMPGPGGGGAIWSGRMVPEKAPDLAIQAARLAGVPIALAGPIQDRGYFCERVEPLLGDDARYLGHLDHVGLVAAVGAARVCVVTPCWDEPYGLVAAEALACGTPVAGFDRGGIVEVVDERCGRLARPGDLEGLALAIVEAARLPRAAARGRAVAHCSLEVMVDQYERAYLGLARGMAA